jgi:Bacterial SH3 domain
MIVLVVGLLGAGATSLLLLGGRRRSETLHADLATVPAPLSQAYRPSQSAVTPIEEENLPRWLRASVRAERFYTPAREPSASVRPRRVLAFDEPAASGVRLEVRYDHVDVLDEPNEAYARTLTQVGTGDEVEILEQTEAWALVRTPRGVTGWLPSMTVGAAPTAVEGPTDPSPAPEKPSRMRRARRARSTT